MSHHSFAHLHVHSTYSDGLNTPEELVTAARDLGQSVIGLTDHNTILGHSAMVRAAQNAGLRTVLGAEVRAYSRFGAGHVLILSGSAEEYANLRDLLKSRRRILLHELKGTGAITSACLGGLVASLLKHGDYWSARDTVLEFQHMLGEQYYLEVQPNFGALLPWFFAISREQHVPVVVTNDVHYADLMTYQSYCDRRELSAAAKPEKRWSNGQPARNAITSPMMLRSGLALMSESAMRAMSPFTAYATAMDTTCELAERQSRWTDGSNSGPASDTQAA